MTGGGALMESGNQSAAHSCGPGKRPVYDLWLDKHRAILETSRDTSILDLGCGYGNDSLYLAERGYRVLACDLKPAAVENVRRFVPSVEARLLDMRGGLPFGKETFRVVVADLSLHYFPWAETVRIVQDITGVLRDGGHLLCRLNSVCDYSFGAGQGIPIEENFYEIDGLRKRFFDRPQIDALFAGWEIKYIREDRLDRYKKPKMLWELALRKK